MHYSETLSRVTYGSDAIQRAMREIEVKDSICDKAKGIIDAEISYQRDFRDMLLWIHSEDPMLTHSSLTERTRTADEYQFCGTWLFQTPEFEAWNSGQSQCLWLCGTGVDNLVLDALSLTRW